jgi:WhiB family transcriptional regulator, redox-sensing transcriptional regulator
MDSYDRVSPSGTASLLTTFGMLDEASEAMGNWTLMAACATADPGLFFPVAGIPGLKAKKVCARCLVRSDCLRYALASGQDWGIRGGLDAAERRRLARRQRRRRPRTQGEITAGGVV